MLAESKTEVAEKVSVKTKVCVNLEFREFLGGLFYRNTANGILSSYKNQLKILKRAKIKYTEDSDSKDYNILQLNLMGPKAIYLIKRDRKRGRKVVSYAHMTPEDFQNAFWFSAIVTPFLKRFLVYMHNQVDVVLCPSIYTTKLMARHGIKKPLIHVSNGVDVDKFCFNKKKREDGRKDYKLKRLTIFSVGQVLPRKSTQTFLDAAEKFPEHDFIWFGVIYHRLLAKKLPSLPSNLRFTGFVEDIVSPFCAGDIFLFPSYEENEGMAILEAASMGLPIIVRDLPVYEGWLIDGVNCMKANTPEEFNNAIKKLADSPDLRESLGREALKLAQKNSTENVGKKLSEIYKKILSESKA